MARRRKLFPRSVRMAVLEKTASRCYSCGTVMAFEDDWWVEHINPFSQEGSDELDNLLPSCKPCNHIRASNDPKLIRSMLVAGESMVREMQKGTKLGKAVREHLERAEARRRKRRKHLDYTLRPLEI